MIGLTVVDCVLTKRLHNILNVKMWSNELNLCSMKW